MKVSNILLLGAGSIGKRHLFNLRQLRPQANIVVYDPVATIAPDPKVLLVRDHPEQFTVDCAVIASPTEHHCQQALKLVRKNIPIYIEKPVCSKSEFGILIAPIMMYSKSTCGFQYRFHPTVEKNWAAWL